jgi:hypothetical protein
MPEIMINFSGKLYSRCTYMKPGGRHAYCQPLAGLPCLWRRSHWSKSGAQGLSYRELHAYVPSLQGSDREAIFVRGCGKRAPTLYINIISCVYIRPVSSTPPSYYFFSAVGRLRGWVGETALTSPRISLKRASFALSSVSFLIGKYVIKYLNIIT